MISLKRLRKLKLKRLEEVGAESGICWQSLYRYEIKDAMPRFDNACKLMDYYGLTLEEMREYFDC